MSHTRPTLILHPLHHTTADIVKRFTLGEPLTPEQVNFLDWHQMQLSDPNFDPILKYYLRSRGDYHHNLHTSFLLPHEKINRESIALLKKRLSIMLQSEEQHEYPADQKQEKPQEQQRNQSENQKIQEPPRRRVVLSLTPQQLLEFKECTIQELIFWHGNQFLTGAPFYPSGTPPLILFQWGNFFGIIKYVVIAGEKAVMGNLLLYFEEMQERSLERCVLDYQKRRTEELKLQNTLLHNKEIILSHDKKLIKTPELTVSKTYLIDHLPKPRPY